MVWQQEHVEAKVIDALHAVVPLSRPRRAHCHHRTKPHGVALRRRNIVKGIS
jgi:hypothetical protein